MYLYAFEGVENPIILEDNTFGHITFELFKGIRINKFGSNVFKKTANKLQSVWCWDCDIQNQLPKYDLFTVSNIYFAKSFKF